MIRNSFDSEKLSDDNLNIIKSSIKEIRESILINDLKDILNVKDNIINDISISNSASQNNLRDIPEWVITGDFDRKLNDLIISNKTDGSKIVFEGYYSNYSLIDIFTENGLLLKSSVITALAGPLIKGEYAQTDSSEILSIGEVSQITGDVTSTGLDGIQRKLKVGTQVFQSDVIETLGKGSVGITFIDKTTLSLSDNGRMVLDELVYDPSTSAGSLSIDMVEGAFSFISGEIAKTGPGSMEITTPVATVGIRGTTVAGRAAIEGNENSFTLLQDTDGSVGEISISNEGGTQILGQVGATTSLTSFNIAPPTPIILSAAEIQSAYGTALNVLPPTPVVAPQPREAEPEQESEEDVQEQSEDENSEEDSEDEVTEEGEASEEETSEENEEVSESTEILDESEEENVLDSAQDATEEVISESTSDLESTSEEVTGDGQETFETALAGGASPTEAMAQAVESSGLDGNLSNNIEDTEPLENLPIPSQIITSSIQNNSNFIPETLQNGFGVSAQPGSQIVLNSENLVPINSFSSSVFLEQTAFLSNPLISNNLSDFYNETSSDYTEPFYFDDPSLYEVVPSETLSVEEYSENTQTNSETGTSGDDTIDKSGTSDSWYLLGNDGNDILYGGLNNDVIYGGKGKDIMQGSTGNDIFYYKSGDLDGGFDKILDFQKNGDLDQLIASTVPSSAYSRTDIFTDTSVNGTLYDISSNAGNLPHVFNFTEPHNTSSVSLASGVLSALTGFGITTGDSSTLAQTETFQFVLTDGVDSFFWLWEDDNKSGYIAESELYPIAVAFDYENSSMTGNEFDYQTISGI